MKVLVLHGPNLNLLGQRKGDPAVSLEELNRALRTHALELGIELRVLQSNHEGVLIDALHAERAWADGVVINPGALTHSSYALREAIAAIGVPTIEVHLTDIRKREPWRRKSVLKDVCLAQVLGKGVDSYRLALDRLAKQHGLVPTRATKGGASTAAGRKTIGRRNVPNRAAVHEPTPALASPGREPSTRANEPRPALHLATPTREGPAKRAGKTIGRRATAPSSDTTPSAKTLGRAAPSRATSFGGLTRAQVREKIRQRLAGALPPGELASWARAQYLALQAGGAVEAEHRELLEDTLQTLTVSASPAARISEHDLITLLARLDR